jgi:hypothetical protein
MSDVDHLASLNLLGLVVDAGLLLQGFLAAMVTIAVSNDNKRKGTTIKVKRRDSE